jgi:hypothetical protein
MPGVVVRECTEEDDEAVLSLLASVADEGAAQSPDVVRGRAASEMARGTATIGMFLDGRLIGIDQMRPGPDAWYNAWFAMLPEFRKRFSPRWMRMLGQELTARYWDLGMRKARTRATIARPEIAAGLLRRGWRQASDDRDPVWQTFEKEWSERPQPRYDLTRLRPASPGDGWSQES